MAADYIRIKGARTNNLKNVSLDIPRNKLVVITGLSGSGKSSLAFDTIYAEGQRRYVESLSSYARQFVGLMDKPDVDLIEGLSPAISIDQRTISHNPRSTVGTTAEIYDYLRLLYARLGVPVCPDCGQKMEKVSQEKIITKKVKGRQIKFSQLDRFFLCKSCDKKVAELEPRDFSFNSAHGACPACAGLGEKMEISAELVFNKNLSVLEGAIKPIAHVNVKGSLLIAELEDLAKRHGFSLRTAIADLSAKDRKIILFGDSEFPGVVARLDEKYQDTKSALVKTEIEKVMHSSLCPVCRGQRLKESSLAVKINGASIIDLTEKSITELIKLFKEWLIKSEASAEDFQIVEPIIKESLKNLEFLSNVGLAYLSLSRSAATLSGGESQRIRLASQVGSSLSGVLYVLDEPSIGLHQRDNDRLIQTLKDLRDNGNTVIVVEHDMSMMLAADYLIDVGPGAGEHGGEIIFCGEPEKIKLEPASLTGAYLSAKKRISSPVKYRKGNGKSVLIKGARENNLKNIDVQIPLAKLVAITGVSGSGKSTLMNEILAKALNKKFYRAKAEPGKHDSISGLECVNKVINIDQSPIGKTPRSNPATYTGIFSFVREIFSSLPEAKVKGFGPGHFSFNVPGGRCENCSGDGSIKVEMQFLADVYLTCEVCNGHKFKEEILAIKYKEKSIFDVLNMTVSEALPFFLDHPQISQKLKTLNEVGMGYIKLGQSATTFSGGEAQRIKLATELSRRSTGKTLYILDEPTTGLHFDDIERLLKVLNMLVDNGNTVLIIEHNLEVIRATDWIIDLGPGGGEEGGRVVVCGDPKQVAKEKSSFTGRYLKEMIK